MPGAPQRKTGRTVARPSSSSGIRAGVTVTAACTQRLLDDWFDGAQVCDVRAASVGAAGRHRSPFSAAPGPVCPR
ncbi:hypothetical protein GCM10010515_20920 [Streptomyces fructofermentans]|uniref:Uncharacterized protein n=1 Tax=Streptomyces fructofermentans TaxID=152141 RepID=A0A918K7E9_9ACTN|nr:hypothetical protein GCM10010515_20920 [Streptomyces fructofermentans]